MKNICLVLLFCVFGLTLSAQKIFAGFNFAPQINVVDFKTVSQGLPLHTLAWSDVSPSTSIALGYTVAGNNFVQAYIRPDWYVVNLINTAGQSNFLGIGYTLPIPETKEVLFLEIGSNYDRKFSKKSFNCVISAGIFITRRVKI